MKSESGNKKYGKVLILATMLFVLFTVGAMFFYFSSTVDASAAVRGDEVVLPPDVFDPTEPTPSDITPSDITPSDITPSDITPSDIPTEPITVENFKDIDKTGWYIDGIKYAIGHGLMNGVGADKFEPDGNLTRAMLVTVLYRLEGTPDVNGATIPFTDVKSSDWYYKAVIWAYKEKIGNGTSETTFAPNAPVTREQLVTFLWRYVEKPTSVKDLSSFSDSENISAYAFTAMQWAVENGIINGRGGGRIAPQEFASRAEIAVIFMRSEKVLA